jgi:hypothetical protein
MVFRLKAPARRPHRGPSGKSKQNAPQKKSARRREALFENPGKITTHTVPLVAIQRQTASKRAEILDWVSGFVIFGTALDLLSILFFMF